MDLFEHQAKELFAEYGVPVPTGKVAHTPEEARAIAEELRRGSSKVVVKAQVKTGGRGKAGGVKLADSADEAETLAGQILGMDIKGHTVHKVLVEEGSAIAQEYYFSFLLDRANRTFLSICSVEGGMEIEEVPHDPALAKVPISPLDGRRPGQGPQIASRPASAEALDGAAEIIERLWAVFTDEDATLVEVNPMILTADGRVVGPGRQGHPGRQRRLPPGPRDARRQGRRRPAGGRGQGEGPQLRQAGRQVGIIGNGAGLVMSTLDVVAYAGEEFGGAEAGQLPRHRRRRVGRGDGQRPGDRAVGPDVKSRVRERLRRHHRLRRGRQRDRPGVQAAGERGETVDRRSSSGWTATTPTAGARSSSDAGADGVEQVDTMDDAARRAAELAAQGHDRWPSGSPRTARSSFRASPAPRAASTPAGCWPPARRSSAASTPARPGRPSTSTAPAARVRHRQGGDGARPARTCRSCSSRRSSPRTPSSRRSTRRSRSAS